MAAAAPNLPAISPPVLPNGSSGVQHRGLLTVEFDVDEWRFVLELYNVRSKTKDQELSSTICSVVTDAVVEIKRLSGNLALAVFDTIEHAQTALRIQTHLFSARTIVLASEEARSKIRQMGLHHSLKPAIRRPVEDSLPRCTSIGIRVNDDIRSLCRSVDMVSVVESLTSNSSVADRIDAFLGVVQINEHDLGRGMDIVNQVEQIFRKKYPNCVATVFGSVVAGLGLKGSDLDVYIELGDDPSRRKTDTEYVNETAPLLYGHEKEFIILRKIPTARVPIIRLFSTALSTSLDISFSNSMGVCNSRLMKSYMTFDPAVHKVVQIVRWWARVRAMTSRQGGFTSYSVVWFVLFFFMNRTKRPKVPSPYSVLQTAKAMGVATVLDGWQCGVVPIHMVPEVSTYEIDPNPPSIPDLLCEFFKFYTEYDFASVVTCTFLGRTLPRAMFGDPRLLLPHELDDYVEAFSRPGFEPLEVDHSFVTQDPFRLEQNLNRNTLVNNCERFVIECRRSEWTLRETMALGTPQEGMYAMLQLALGENQARRAASSVYNDQVLPQCPHKYPEYQGGIFVTFGQATVSKRFVRESRLEVVGRSPDELSRMHLVAWRDKVVATSFKILADCLLMDVWDLCGVPGPDAMDDPYSVAMYNAPIPPVTRAQCADFLTQPFSYTESAGVNFRALSLPGWLNLWQQFDKDYFVRPGLMRSFHAMRGKRVVDMINAGPQCNSGLLLKRFFCEARWPTFTVRRDAGKAGTFAEEASWSAVIVRALNGSFEGRIDDRPLPKFNYIVEFYELQGMPLNGLLIRCLHAPVSPDGFILSCGLDHSLAVFLRSLLTSELRRMDAAVVFPSNH